MSYSAAPRSEPALFQSRSMDRQEFSRIKEILYAESGIAITEAKTSLVQSRLANRLRDLGLESFRAYIDMLTGPDGHDERMRLINALTTNVTNFFREVHHFDHLRDDVFPSLRKRLEEGGRARIWSAGCSSGQEPFSIAMTVHPLMQGLLKPDFKILASDIDTKVIAHGRDAIYREDLLDGIPTALQSTYLEPSLQKDHVQFVDALRNLIAFKRLNLLESWPMKGQFDVIFCRNVVIYFDDPTRERLWKRFAKALVPGGMLYIGHSERLKPSMNSYFENIGPTAYVRTDQIVSDD